MRAGSGIFHCRQVIVQCGKVVASFQSQNHILKVCESSVQCLFSAPQLHMSVFNKLYYKCHYGKQEVVSYDCLFSVGKLWPFLNLRKCGK